MVAHIEDKSKLDDTMKWHRKGFCGHVVQQTDRKLGIVARKVYGDPERWPELVTLNNISMIPTGPSSA